MKIENENGYIIYGEDELEENEIVIELVEAYSKRTGTGSKLVKEVLDIADSEGKDVSLCAYPQDDSIELEALVEFYNSLGFNVEYDDGNEVLMRYSA